jgi:Bacterial membrane protein YfhO
VGLRCVLFDARSYDYPVEARYDRLWRGEVAPPGERRPPTTVIELSPRALRVLGAFGVRNLLQDPTDPPLTLPLAYSGRDARVYENPSAAPRVALVGAQWVVGGEGAARRALADARFDPRRALAVARPLPGLPFTGPAGAPAAGEARLAHHGPQRVRVTVDAQRAGEMVLSDLSYPGWQATVDGRTARLDRVNYLFRGVPVPAGRHVVEMRYEPASWRAGWIVSLLALLALVAAAGVGWRRR